MYDELNLQEPVNDVFASMNGYYLRDGFWFHRSPSLGPPIYDILLMRNPAHAESHSKELGLRYCEPQRTLDEHIELVRKHQLKRAWVYAETLDFLTECPSLEEIFIQPANTVEDGFDYSPLYRMPNIRKLHCPAEYGRVLYGLYHTEIDLSRIAGLESVHVCDEGHKNYLDVPTLKRLSIGGSTRHRDMTEIGRLHELRQLRMIQCNVRDFQGIGEAQKLELVDLWYCRSLKDLSALVEVAPTLKYLGLDTCSGLKDFSFLEELTNLEVLYLEGNNSLENLHFLKKMPNLKKFCVKMNVLDGDLSLCLNIPAAFCKNRKHYNLKDKDLPKNVMELECEREM